MNFATANKVVSLFPRSSFIKRKSYTTKGLYRQRGEVTTLGRTYRTRGFQLIDGRSQEIHDDFRVGRRHIMDGQSWVIHYGGIQGMYQLLNLNFHALVTFCIEDSEGYEYPHAFPEENFAFEVLDWRTGKRSCPAYARLSEPFVER